MVAIMLAAAGALTAVVLPAAGATGSTTLTGAATLASGQDLVSADGHFTLRMETDGNLAETVAGGLTLWTSGTAGHAGAHLVMGTNGNLVIYGTDGEVVWSSNSTTTGCPQLVLQNDGNQVIYATKPAWANGIVDNHVYSGGELLAGWAIYSPPPEEFRLAMQSDGNLVLRDASGKPLWSSGTGHHPGANAVMQSDGNLVVYDKTAHALWSSGAGGNAGSHLTMQSDGNLVVYSTAGHALWSSHTSHQGTGGTQAPTAPPAITCPPPPPPTTTTTVTTTTTATTTTPVIVTVPVPTPLPTPVRVRHALKIKLTIFWTWDRGTTRLRSTKIGRFPGRTRMTVTCRGRGCPRRHRTMTAVGHRGLHHLLRALTGRRYRVGETLEIRMSAPGRRDEAASVVFRDGRKPRLLRVRR